MNRPLVSVVMPVYNAEKYLKSAVESILNQSYPDLDIVIVNDGSTDHSKDIILNFQDARLRFFENPGNCGIVKTRNRGLDEAKGEYIAIMDSDDIALPNRIQVQVDFLEKNAGYGMCGSYFQTIDGDGNLLKVVNFPSNDKDARSHLMVHNCFCHSTVMMRGKMAKEMKYDPEFDVVEDYQLWYRISKKTKIINLPVYTTYYRVHGNNVSTTRNNHMFTLQRKLNSAILDDLNISYSQDELSLHSNSLIYNYNFFKAKGRISELENWMLKFLAEIDKNKSYNELIIYKILAKKWVVICIKSRNYRKLFFNKLVLRHSLEYFNTLFKKAWGSIN